MFSGREREHTTLHWSRLKFLITFNLILVVYILKLCKAQAFSPISCRPVTLCPNILVLEVWPAILSMMQALFPEFFLKCEVKKETAWSHHVWGILYSGWVHWLMCFGIVTCHILYSHHWTSTVAAIHLLLLLLWWVNRPLKIMYRFHGRAELPS